MSVTCGNTFSAGAILNEKYVILEFLGRGGMGEVYRAHQLSLNRYVAIKVISQEWVKSFEGDTGAMRTSLERFRREVQVMAQIRHPNVLQIFDYGSATVEREGEKLALEYIAMEYIPGGTLRTAMSEEGFYPDKERTREWLKKYFLPLVEGVQALHEAGIIHRDLKPENVLLDGGVPKIADFGLARSFHLKPLTQSVDIQGTPPYMSPEHFLDLKRTDERTDVYALGKILYEAVSGKMKSDQIPFRKASLTNPKGPLFQGLDRLIQAATAEERHGRFPSVAAMQEALGEVLGNPPQAITPAFSSGFPRQEHRGKRIALSGVLVLALSVATGVGAMLFTGGFQTPVFTQDSPHALEALREPPASVAPYGASSSLDSPLVRQQDALSRSDADKADPEAGLHVPESIGPAADVVSKASGLGTGQAEAPGSDGSLAAPPREALPVTPEPTPEVKQSPKPAKQIADSAGTKRKPARSASKKKAASPPAPAKAPSVVARSQAEGIPASESRERVRQEPELPSVPIAPRTASPPAKEVKRSGGSC